MTNMKLLIDRPVWGGGYGLSSRCGLCSDHITPMNPSPLPLQAEEGRGPPKKADGEGPGGERLRFRV